MACDSVGIFFFFAVIAFEKISTCIGGIDSNFHYESSTASEITNPHLSHLCRNWDTGKEGYQNYRLTSNSRMKWCSYRSCMGHKRVT